jgi:hypothetical protein
MCAFRAQIVPCNTRAQFNDLIGDSVQFRAGGDTRFKCKKGQLGLALEVKVGVNSLPGAIS